MVITLAFPNREHLNRGMNSSGVYAFLPTKMVTNFPNNSGRFSFSIIKGSHDYGQQMEPRDS
ncbi:hypothetical protein ACSBR2_042390 [Camellia fascicularis]